MTHRLFYEGISFHWHEKGKCHLLYNPTFQVNFASLVARKLPVAMATVATTTFVAMATG